MEDKEKSKISNTEWGLVIGALLVIDAIQIVLDLLLDIGAFTNRFIDIFVGLSLVFYLWNREPNLLKDPKLLGSIGGAFVLEEIPDVDALPFWTLDGLYAMSLSKKKSIIAKVPGGKMAESVIKKIK